MTKIIPSIETLTGGTADRFVVSAGAGVPVQLLTGAQAKTALGVTDGATGATGATGSTGATGATGAAGPNSVSGTTSTALNGILRGTGTVVDTVTVSTGLAFAAGSLSVSFGTTSTTVCVGNDSRLSDARTPTAHTHPQVDVTNLTTDLAAKQATLVSGTNIKTVNSTSLLGSGDITVGLSGTGSVDNAVLRADGTGGATLQASAFVIADNATASPNNTVNHASLQATGGTTNVSLSIVPKGAGAFCLAVPDGTATGGNVRGDNAIDMQSYRTSATQVASSGRSVAIGSRNTSSNTETAAVGGLNSATGVRSSAFGYSNTSSGNRTSAIGWTNTASGNYSSAVGYQNTASGQYGSAMGNLSVASATKSSAFGFRATTSVANTCEVGYWPSASVRGAAVRVHGTTGMSSMSVQNRATAYTDGGATAGAEADNTLGREMISLRRNGDVLLLDVNVAGTVKTLSLGTAT